MVHWKEDEVLLDKGKVNSDEDGNVVQEISVGIYTRRPRRPVELALRTQSMLYRSTIYWTGLLALNHTLDVTRTCHYQH